MNYVLAFDTANEIVAIGLGLAPEGSDATNAALELVASREIAAHRASNTMLIAQVDGLLREAGVAKGDIAALVCGRGPGSFTGVRICMATAKGMAQALEVPLFGVSTLDAVAWNAWSEGVRGRVLVAADAMRKEVYPALFDVDDCGVERLTADAVVKAAEAPAWVASMNEDGCDLQIAGDGLVKYREIFEPCGTVLAEALWGVTGAGLLLARRVGGNPATMLPVYTRLSDAEENERMRLAKADPAAAQAPKNLVSGVQDIALETKDAIEICKQIDNKYLKDTSNTKNQNNTIDTITSDQEVQFKPLDTRHVNDVAQLDALALPKDAWTPAMIADELPRKDRTWWAAYAGEEIAGFCGGLIVAGQVEILKIATNPAFRRRGIAAELIARVANDARDLGATEMTLEVRASNAGAQAFYERMGLVSVGVRPGYYPDREDAVIMTGPLPVLERDVAGMRLHVDDLSQAPAAQSASGEADAVSSAPASPLAGNTGASSLKTPRQPLILAIESSCDETAAAIIDGAGALLSDVVASQIDFHARFGGVVPEIASRKHIEAICGVCDECLDVAARALGRPALRWRDLDAVAVTYAPGLVGALVVGLAFAKGAAWGADLPLIAVNHLEGHLYANKIATPDIQPPMVVSLVSGGHTMLVHVRGWGDYVTLGSTIDDAAGEAFDKVAKALGLGYPGGPVISKLAAQGNPKAIDFPRALLHSGDLRFSLSGLKTAVVTHIQKEQAAGRALNMPDIAASFQAAVVDVQVAKAKAALLQTGAKEFCLGGGVAANPALRAAYEKMCASIGVRLTMPPLRACGDQAAMIAEVALDRFEQGKFADWSLDVKAHAPLDEPY